MKTIQLNLVIGLLASTISASAVTRYVDLNSPGPAFPYTDWATAATNIQDALNWSGPGDQVLVTNGVYETGGRVAAQDRFLTNRVVVPTSVKLRSVNGPEVTFIKGYQMPGSIVGSNAVRCVYLGDFASLIGFTLTNGATDNTVTKPDMGGGIYCTANSLMVSNCVLAGNTAGLGQGGGAYRGKLKSCILSGNSAGSGGGSYLSDLDSCLVISNSATGNGGGAYDGNLKNCTIVGNSAGVFGGGMYHNVNLKGSLVNCIVYYNTAPGGSNYALFGSFVTNSCTLPMAGGGNGNITNVPLFVDQAGGNFHLQLGSPCINKGNNVYATNSTDLGGKPRIVGGIVDMGAYEFQTHFVDLSCTNPTPPYINWSTAATNIQDAIDVADAGDQVLVTNGIYQTGGRVVHGSLTNRVAVTKPLTLQSANGCDVTVIKGYQVPGMTNGDSAIRCVYLTNGAALVGFTLTNGATLTNGNNSFEQSGGGAWNGSVISDCLLVGNAAAYEGGGTFDGELNYCTLTRNSAKYGGGASRCILNNCLITGNSARGGGGTSDARLTNCTVTGNTGGGVSQQFYPSALVFRNCIIYSNVGANYVTDLLTHFANCCTVPLPSTGIGNFTNAPLFVDQAGGNLRLQSNSPCINAGKNASAPTGPDLDGNPRIVAGTVDIGAYEYQTPSSVLSYAWAQQYGLPTDGSADYANDDTDNHNNWQEWKADTNPTNSQSVLKMLTPSGALPGVLVQWQSTNSRTYFLQRAAGLPSFSNLASNIVGQIGTTTYTNTSATNGGPFFYRVGVQE